jgi:uncharacterized membrane protein
MNAPHFPMDDLAVRGFPERMSLLRTGTLLAAAVTTGLMAGIFADWSNAIMPGLSEVDDRTFVETFRALDRAITNPLFLGGFTIALLLIALSAVLHLGADQRPVLMWVGVALASYLLTVVITFAVHEPLNVRLRTGTGDLAAARALLDEARWTAWNTVRAVSSTIAFTALAWALVIHRRPVRTENFVARVDPAAARST